MLNDQICELRDKLNKSILTEDYEVTYELSIQLDDLITEYYGINKDEARIELN
ncbi:MAG: aspartyl-phosphate phosphatase Spo0E family protein [Clostridia bacterium]|nr:aspartyl-phosphate phosphatase Spo0E family protein [Clostridia bacterium]